MSLPVKKGNFWTLDFDIENRPITYWQPDRPTAEITAIACAWTDQPSKAWSWLLGRDDPVEMLKAFTELYNAADQVTGHYIRKHDLPIINAHLILYGLRPLGPKLTQDTKLDLIKRKDLPASQQDLAEMLGVKAPKIGMSQTKWRQANQLTSEGLMLTQRRVEGDVKQHMAMRKVLLQRGLLHPPKVWKP